MARLANFGGEAGRMKCSRIDENRCLGTELGSRTGDLGLTAADAGWWRRCTDA